MIHPNPNLHLRTVHQDVSINSLAQSTILLKKSNILTIIVWCSYGATNDSNSSFKLNTHYSKCPAILIHTKETFDNFYVMFTSVYIVCAQSIIHAAFYANL